MKKNKIKCPCCGMSHTIQVGFSGNHATYTLLDEPIHYLICIDCGYDSREYSDFYSEQELINYFKRTND